MGGEQRRHVLDIVHGTLNGKTSAMLFIPVRDAEGTAPDRAALTCTPRYAAPCSFRFCGHKSIRIDCCATCRVRPCEKELRQWPVLG